MQKLSHHYPDDPDAATLYAESLLDVNPWNQWSLEGKPLQGTMEAVRALQSVIREFPDHLGANHYLIHAVEASFHPEIALMSAERLKTLLPSSGHILHMPSHIYLLVGDYIQAIHSNLAAVAADREYIKQYGMDGIYPLHYLSHNLYFLSRAYTMQGCFEDAKQAADDLTTFYTKHFKKMQDLEYYASAPLTVLITFHRWEDILKMPPPKEDMQITTMLWRFGRALAFANLGNRAQAMNEQRLFLEGKNQINPDQVFGYNRAHQILIIAENCLHAKLAEVQGNFDQALNFLQKAVDVQDQLKYNEPPDWFFPVREALGGLLLRMQKPQEAEKIFRQSLKRHPRSGRALFGLRESLKAQSKIFDEYWVNEEFQKAWRYSTISLNINDF
jgi:tetratricopeptide (TPR) repeat protein